VQSVFHNDEIETEILRASSTSEFTHSLDPNRTNCDPPVGLKLL
jgi:hypothetical protein